MTITLLQRTSTPSHPPDTDSRSTKSPPPPSPTNRILCTFRSNFALIGVYFVRLYRENYGMITHKRFPRELCSTIPSGKREGFDKDSWYTERKVFWINKIGVARSATVICCQLNTICNWSNYFIDWKQKHNNKMYSSNYVLAMCTTVGGVARDSITWSRRREIGSWTYVIV